MIKIIEGNILNADVDVICQQVNSMGVMGAGLAKQIKERYPEVYFYYKELCNKTKSELLLGYTQIIECHNGRYIANLFGQSGYGRDKKYTNYNALNKSLTVVADRVKQYHETIAIPYGLGCGLARGDWSIVYKMIEDVFGDYDVTIYKYKP